MPLLRTLLLNAMVGLAGYWSARHGFGMPPGVPRVLGALTLAWAWATLGMEILGCLGFLSYGPLLAWAAAGCVVGLYLRGFRVHDRTTEVPIPVARDGRWEAAAIVALGLVLWVTVIHGLNALVGPVKVVSDGPIYHLVFAARWWKEGRISLVAAPFGDVAVTYFPAVGDLWFTWLMIGWGGERLAKVGQLPFLLAAGIAASGCARRLGAGASAAVIATCWFVTCLPFFIFTMQPNVDTILVASYLVATFFFLRYTMGDEGQGALLLGALASGGVLGTKPTGIVFGALLLGTAALAVLVRRGTFRRVIGDWILLAGFPLVMAGFWYGRNLLLTGNPLYPLHLQAFGRVWLAGWYGSGEMRLSQYYISVGDWRAFVDILLTIFDPRLVPIWILALAGAGAWALKRRPLPEDRWVWACSAMALANVAGYWLLIPYRTQQRFMLQAVGLMVVPLARLLDRAPWLRTMATGLLTIHLITMQSWPFGRPDREPPWDLSAIVPNVVPPLLYFPSLHKLGRGGTPEPEDVSRTVTMFAFGAGSLGVAWLWSRPGGRAHTRACLVSLVVLAATIVVAYPYRVDPRTLFFEGFPDYRRGWVHLDRFAGPSGARIAYAGTNMPYYLMGVGLRNRVRYVNVDEHRGWLLHDYHKRAQQRGEPTWPNPWPTWDRVNPDYGAWLANLRAEKIQLLVVASMGRPAGSLPDADRDRFPIERRWAESHPESFEPLYGVKEGDPKFRIYRVLPERPPDDLQGTL